MTEATRIYHNPRCSKSRQALALLEEQGIRPEVVRYLDTPPTAPELAHLLTLLGLSARDLMRKKEAPYQALALDNPALSEAELIDAMVNNPVLIERPIVLHDGKAVVGRPPENVLNILCPL
ncbi:MAG: arsenate reductase (glutaredoxin) [Marinobacter sp.]|nr:arsenate reductase (glutaredoxin) [Marinobacter sp.]